MNLDLRYHGRSIVVSRRVGATIGFAANLARGDVQFDGSVRDPVRYREAMSALHAVVVSDLRFGKRDKSAYEAFKQAREAREQAVRSGAAKEAYAEALARAPGEPPPDLDARFRQMHTKYWRERRAWAVELSRKDPALFRSLVPCDPIVTVAPDVVFFEGFSKDESSYGCVFVDRDAFTGPPDTALGTTNVDYSLALYDQVQDLRSYRATRLCVDPGGFEVHAGEGSVHREEKIDLPPTWLRGFGQVQAAAALQGLRVELEPALLHGLITHLRLHREKTGPRAIRFVLRGGKPVVLQLEPWGTALESRTIWRGPDRDVRVWGRRRLAVLARTLPLAERVEVRLLGNGLPHLWTVSMGPMRMVLGLSGWTTNDWTSGLGLDLLAGLEGPPPGLLDIVATALHEAKASTTAGLAARLRADPADVNRALVALAKRGQCVYDAAHDVHRYRSALPWELGEAQIGPDHPELVGARELLLGKRVRVADRADVEGVRVVTGAVGGEDVEVAITSDGAIKHARCGCSWSRSHGIRRGPCRHVLALRMTAETQPGAGA